MIKYRDHKFIQKIIAMTCPSDQNKYEKLQKYQQLAYKIREKRPGYHVDILPVVIGCMRGGANKLREQKYWKQKNRKLQGLGVI